MSYDFTVLIPELIGTHEQASALHSAMCQEPDEESVPDNVQRFVDELNAKYGYDNDEESGFLSIAPLDGDARGVVVPTWALSATGNRAAMLELTRDHGLGLYDPQRDRLYDPRGHIDLTVQLGEGHEVPYLSPGLLTELFDHPHPAYPWLVIERREQHFIQSFFPPDGHVAVEYRRGDPDQHYRAFTEDRQLAQRVLWHWATGTTEWESALRWEPMDFS
ncbi:hypothetical protein ACNQR7_07640 [Mycolicibacterium senegalense]|uniref:hypothetical protein n=1 Tax=Mycolicibacterium senegalense TaxID=1796 RepID=UPI003AB0D9B8